MNTFDWMADQPEEAQPLREDDSREDPSHRPKVPDDGNGPAEDHHGDPVPSQGGRNHDAVNAEPHQQEHTILDPQQQEDLTASNESIIESVRKFFKMHNRGKNFEELDGNTKASMAKVYKNLEATFGSNEWVEKQTSITGEIKVGDLADRIGLDNLVGSIKETAAINDSFQEAIIAAQLTVVREIAQLTSKWNPDKLTDKMYEEVKAKLPSIKSMADLMKKPTRAKTNLITGKQTDEKRAPLTKEETLALAQEIVKAMKADHARILSTNEEIHTLLQKFWDVQYEVRREDAHSESYNTAAWETLIEALARKMPASSPESMAAFRQFEGACVASVIYMERSFRGGKTEE